MAGCSGKSGEPSSAEQGTVVESADQPPGRESALPTDEGQLASLFDQIRNALLDDSDKYYEVTISVQQYEGMSDVTWYFDSLFAPRYFTEAWAYEGREGTTEYIVEKGTIVCAEVEENNVQEKWCQVTGGTRTRWNDGTGEETLEVLSSDFASRQNSKLLSDLDNLKTLLREGELADEDEETFTIRSASTADAGMEVTESVEVRIPRPLYEALKT